MRLKFIFFIIVSIFLSGCMDSQEIDERNFVLSFGIDKGKEDNYDVTMGIANPAIKKENSIGFEVETGNGDTLAKAMRENETKFTRDMYYGHTKNIVISRNILEEKEQLETIVDTLMRSNKFSLKTDILCADESAEKCIQGVQEEGKGDGLYVWDYYKNNAAKVENTVRLNLKELGEGVRGKSSLVIPLIKFSEDRPLISGGAVFDGEKVCGILTKDEMLGYSLAMQNCAGYILQIHVNGVQVPIFIKKTTCDIEENGDMLLFKGKIKADIKGEGNINTYEGEDIEEVEQALKEYVSQSIKNAMTAMKDLEIEEFKGKTINVEIEAKISGTGVIR